MTLPILLIVLVGFGLAASAVAALYWAARNGQLQDFERGAQSIFDEGEPVGVPTDRVFRRRTRKPKSA